MSFKYYTHGVLTLKAYSSSNPNINTLTLIKRKTHVIHSVVIRPYTSFMLQTCANAIQHPVQVQPGYLAYLQPWPHYYAPNPSEAMMGAQLVPVIMMATPMYDTGTGVMEPMSVVMQQPGFYPFTSRPPPGFFQPEGEPGPYMTAKAQDVTRQVRSLDLANNSPMLQNKALSPNSAVPNEVEILHGLLHKKNWKLKTEAILYDFHESIANQSELVDKVMISGKVEERELGKCIAII